MLSRRGLLGRRRSARPVAASASRAPPASRAKSASIGRPTIPSPWCSRRRDCWKRNSPRTASASAGCRRSAPTRRSNSSMPARSISARPPAPRRCSARSTAIRSNRSTSIPSRNGPRWSRARTRRSTRSQDLKGKRVAVTRGTDPHIFLVRALLSVGMTEKDINEVLLQHPDGKIALIRGDVDAWAGLDPMMAQAQVEDGARLFYRNKDANTYGILNSREEFLKDLSRSDAARARGLRAGAQILPRQLRRQRSASSWT